MTSDARRRALGLLAAALPLFAGTGSGQHVVPALAPGTRVRVIAPAVRSGPVVGRLESLSDSALVVFRDGGIAPITFPLRDVRRLDVSRGLEPQPVLGAWIGAPVGAALALAAGPIIPSSGGSLAGCCGRGGEIVMDVLIGGTAGAAVGWLVGSTIQAERWQRTSLVRLQAAARGAGLMVSLRF